MSLSKEIIATLVADNGKSAADTGSTEVQIALLTQRITDLTGHMKANTKDFHSRLGLMRIVGHRKSLLKYLRRKNETGYRTLIAKFGIRK